MTVDIESIRRMLTKAQNTGEFPNEPSQVIFAMSQLLREVDRLWNLYPMEATHNWKGKND